MISASEDALICDLAETYHIYDFRSLPVKLVATLSSGLRDNSRIKLILNNEKYTADISLMAMLVDRVAVIQHTICGIKESPKLVTEAMFEETEHDIVKPSTFDSPEEFDEWYEKNRNNKET